LRPFIDRYPLFLRKSPEFRDIQRALEPELVELWAARDGALEQLCVETAGWGLEYWEKTLGIPVDGEKAPETRRSRIRVKLLGSDVTTVELVRSAAEIWSGRPAKVTEYPGEFRFAISFAGTNGVPPHMAELTGAIGELIPAHLGWGYAFAYDAPDALGVGAGGAAEARGALEVGPRRARSVDFTKAAGAGAVSERQGRLEVWPRSAERVEFGRTAGVGTAVERHSRIEVYPAEQEAV